MSEPFLSEIKMFGFDFAPRGWSLCDGQILPIAQNQSLYSLLGTTYGGNGRTDFGLPDLRGRTPVHFGIGPGGVVPLGAKGGAESVVLTEAQMPQHTHTLNANSSPGTSDEPGGTKVFSRAGDDIYGAASSLAAMNAETSLNAGGGQSHNNMQPYQVISFCIYLRGLFP
jgi:microcystin-dependent protein